MTPQRWNAADGPLTEAGLRAKLESLGYRVARYVYEPGTVFPDHKHDVDKIDAVLSGRYMLEQTFYVPVEALQYPERSPLKVLEAVTGQALV